ncbi:MAG: nucleotidyltransferase family protein [Candidatus Aminicenantales bacterium]|jgi:molybdenum cofactor cytidylyltransferase
MIWVTVLAAGESRRMGTQKLLLPFGETTVIEAIVRTALDSEAEGTVVVLGANRERVRGVLKSYPLVFAVNKDYRLGMLSSIQAGFRALPTDAEAAVIMLGDQPTIPARVLDALIRAYRESRRGIVVPVHGGHRGHPVLIDMKNKDEVLGLDPGIGLRQLLRTHPEDVLEVAVSSPEVLKDIDRPEDYREEVDQSSKAHRK